jgi:hypothetical protein
VTAAVMFTLAAGKARPGQALDNPVLRTEGRVTLIDGILAPAVLLGLVLNAALGWWWADPAAGYVLVCYAARETREIFFTPADQVRASDRSRRTCGSTGQEQSWFATCPLLNAAQAKRHNLNLRPLTATIEARPSAEPIGPSRRAPRFTLRNQR